MNNRLDGTGGASPLYVITLTSSTTPMPLKAPSAPELAGLAVFRSRQREENRERFRLHLGYFASFEVAEAMLPYARESYPAAFVAVAPESNLGSLDDTAMARFSVIRQFHAAPGPVAPPAVAAAKTAPVAALPQRSRVEPPASTPRSPTAAPVRNVAAAATPPQAPPRRLAAVATSPAVPAAPTPTATVESEPEKAPQRYAVQLLWSGELIDLGKLPNPSIFEGYLLYAVETERGGRRMFGLRLGFYVDALSAGLVAQYVRPQFRGAMVVPVSDREYARASAAVVRPAALKAARGSGSRTRWPQSALAVEFVAAGSGVPAAQF